MRFDTFTFDGHEELRFWLKTVGQREAWNVAACFPWENPNGQPIIVLVVYHTEGQ